MGKYDNFNFQDRCEKFSEDSTNFLETLYSRSFFKPIITQGLRASTSIAANIVESKCSKTKKEFA